MEMEDQKFDIAIDYDNNGDSDDVKLHDVKTGDSVSNGVDNIAYVDKSAMLEVEGEAPPAADVNPNPIEGGPTRRFLCCKTEQGDVGPEVERVGFFQLFRFADKLDVLMMVVGSLCMMCLGAAIPVNILFFGDLMTNLVMYDRPTTNVSSSTITMSQCATEQLMSVTNGGGALTSTELMDLIVNRHVAAFIGIGVVAFGIAYLGITLWTWTGERQIRRVRCAYFQAVMRQSIDWFDMHDSGELTSRMVEDMERLNDGFGDKMASFIQWFCTFLGGYALGFSTGWKMTLVVMAGCPLLIIVAAALGRFVMTLVKRELLAYAKAGAVAEETFSSIRTVAAFGGEKKAEQKYAANLQDALKEGIRKATVGGVTGGIFWLLIFNIFALAFWYGAKLTREDCLPPGAILQVFFGVMVGSMSLGHAAPLLENFSNARASAALLFKTIDSIVEIDSSSDEGIKPERLHGNIEFIDVNFAYPARKEVQVLKKLNLLVKKGETVALVGESGCGKSTTIQLLQRFYECASGKIFIDGKALQDYNLTWLRNYMGIVSQEPVLFASTIAENIKLGAKWGDEVTQGRIEAAAKEANCYDFITKLPKGFNTLVGERGVQLSGGQKQRIAIARALIRNPSILLLDEATSALDTQSEAVVQNALEKASEGRTTIVIAHRLSTVKAANKIFAFGDGKVQEEGNHYQLMAKKGIYHALVMKQLQQQKEEAEEHRCADLRKNSFSRPRTASTSSALLQPAGIHLEVPGSNAASPYSSPSLGKRFSSLRRSKRMGSFRSLKSLTSDGNVLGMDQAPEIDDMDDLDLEDGVVVARRLISQESVVEQPNVTMWELLKLNKPEWHLIVIGSFASIITGSVQLIFSVIMSEIIGTLSEPDPETQAAKVSDFAIYIVITGVIAAIATIAQNALFALSGERLTMRLRKQTFAAILRQEISYFDDEKNGVGPLTHRLASDASLVKGATGVRIGVYVQSATTVFGALIISFAFVWELTLVMMIFMPIMISTGKFREKLILGQSKQDKVSIAEGGKMAQEAISNMRTVTSLNRQRFFTDRFYQHFKALYKQDLKKSLVHGIVFAVSQTMQFFMYAICFGFGSYLIVCDCTYWRTEKIPFFHVLRIFAAITFGSMAVGRTTSQLPDYTKVLAAASNIKKLLERQSTIDPSETTGEIPQCCNGRIQFTDVEFHYPTRKTIQVLQGLSFSIKQGETLALVGSSGCGKSTSVSLLERFYDVFNGRVSIDGTDITALNLQWLRQQIGIVSQEPTLFDASIADNIAYGDNSQEIPMAEIIAAATKANAHNFITTLPEGYETNVGSKGTQLSGGQKQRIAIARALVRNPPILLLDEATSALDSGSEKIVQEALDKAVQGRTSIVIAHRLSTIRNADRIGVIDNGQIVELGTHQELLDKKGYYSTFIDAQL